MGADLRPVRARFIHWLLADPEHGVLRFATTAEGKKAIQDVANLYTRLLAGGTVERSEWVCAAEAARVIRRKYWAAAAAAAAAEAAAAEAEAAEAAAAEAAEAEAAEAAAEAAAAWASRVAAYRGGGEAAVIRQSE